MKNKKTKQSFLKAGFGVFFSYQDDQGHVCRPQSFKSFWPIRGTSVVEGGTGNIEPARRVYGQLAIDKILVPFTFQHWDKEGEI